MNEHSVNPLIIAIGARMEGILAESDVVNDVFKHNVMRGSAREMFVEEFLRPFLPPSIGIGTGEIINHGGDRSKQLDVVLYNKGMIPPFISRNSTVGLFPWESVIAVIEVKSTITASICDDALLNALSVQTVVRNTERKDVLLGGVEDPEDAESRSAVPYYIFAFSSDQTIPFKEWSRLDGRAAQWSGKYKLAAAEQEKIKQALAVSGLSAEVTRDHYRDLAKASKDLEEATPYLEISSTSVHGIYVPHMDSRYKNMTVNLFPATKQRNAYHHCTFENQASLKPAARIYEAAYFLQMILGSYEAMSLVRKGYSIRRYFERRPEQWVDPESLTNLAEELERVFERPTESGVKQSPAYPVFYGGVRAMLDAVLAFPDYKTLLAINDELLVYLRRMDPAQSNLIRISNETGSGAITITRLVAKSKGAPKSTGETAFETMIMSPPVNLRKELAKHNVTIGMAEVTDGDPEISAFGQNFGYVEVVHALIADSLRAAQAKQLPPVPPEAV
ncbi:DUF6602 domain-containing protein [Pseudoduganella umbonata]|uniref:DUF6602 domain-containing protein n=1 Tax=Pseudoduganella umbonata TaxID=864828 RepID=A0A4P8HIY3_9BURK|nr:DUF6602 domain-containing protein [Pseudoduganella umbonata]MBB3219444.1 hypothetical protein [Pseudoduganella umbonata]QCP09533.1 hypothetical protein FCL38_03175 [Pseudoduganella umbonata]